MPCTFAACCWTLCRTAARNWLLNLVLRWQNDPTCHASPSKGHGTAQCMSRHGLRLAASPLWTPQLRRLLLLRLWKLSLFNTFAIATACQYDLFLVGALPLHDGIILPESLTTDEHLALFFYELGPVNNRTQWHKINQKGGKLTTRHTDDANIKNQIFQEAFTTYESVFSFFEHMDNGKPEDHLCRAGRLFAGFARQVRAARQSAKY